MTAAEHFLCLCSESFLFCSEYLAGSYLANGQARRFGNPSRPEMSRPPRGLLGVGASLSVPRGMPSTVYCTTLGVAPGSVAELKAARFADPELWRG